MRVMRRLNGNAKADLAFPNPDDPNPDPGRQRTMSVGLNKNSDASALSRTLDAGLSHTWRMHQPLTSHMDALQGKHWLWLNLLDDLGALVRDLPTQGKTWRV
jgi:hypothetical protein